jgi:Flp pilus assembly protein TadD/predicted aspartyl protease
VRLALFVIAAVPFSCLLGFQSPAAGPLAEARAELFAARYQSAADSYRKLTAANPPNPEAYYGLVRSLLGAHRSADAYAAADQALQAAPQTAEAENAAGIATFRRGDLQKAELHFRAALKLKPNDPAALLGMAWIYQVVSKNKTAASLVVKAYMQSPQDPDLMWAYADTLKGAAHLAELKAILTRLDPDAEMVHSLRSHIAADEAAGDRKLRRLTSPYESTHVKMFRMLNGVKHQGGVGLHVQFNQHQTLDLLLDTGASGISIAPKAAEKAGLQILGSESFEAKGIGDQDANPAYRYLASEVRIGGVSFADYPVSVFRTAQGRDEDGLIGADVFKRFIVGIDIPDLDLTLDPRPGEANSDEDALTDASDMLPPGFFRAFRFGNHLALPTSVNGGPPVVFLVDTGSSSNLMDIAAARQASKVHGDDRTIIKGVQGNVGKVARANNISLAFAGFRQDNPDVLAIDLEKMSENFGVGFSGILGMPVLGQMKMTIDYREGRVRLEKKIIPLAP